MWVKLSWILVLKIKTKEPMGQPKKKKVRALYHYREVIRIVISPMHVALSAFLMCQNYWSKKLANNSSKWIAHWIKLLKINKELKRKANRIPLHIFLQSASYPHPHVELLCHQERQKPVILFYFLKLVISQRNSNIAP